MTRSEIAQKLKGIDECLIFTHINPDGDTIGSALALSASLKETGREVIVCGMKPIPKVFDFLPGFDEIIDTNDKLVSDKISEGYTIIFVDFTPFHRAGLASIPDSSNVIVIDHHPEIPDPAFNSIVEPGTASNAEIVYHIIKAGNLPLTKEIGNCIMTGILTDTGSFHYSNVTTDTMKTTSELINLGVTISKISELIYERMTLANRRLLGIAMSRLKVSKNKHISYTYISNEDIINNNATKPDLDFIIDEVRKLEGIEVYIIGKEYIPNEFRISMRGRGKVDIRKIAQSFDGGGHRNAAGFTFKGEWDNIIRIIVDKISKELLN